MKEGFQLSSFRCARALFLVTLMFAWAAPQAMAANIDNFTVKKIQVEGLERISEGTVYNYLPISVGDTIDRARLQAALKALYKTGFFKDITFRRDGDTLLVVVQERPSIAHFTIAGNREIKTEDLEKVLKNIGLADGRILDRSVLDQMQQELTDQYFSRGKYGVKINTDVKDVGHNRVDVTITISEGVAARIKSINIVGNKAFDDDSLLDLFKQKVTHFTSSFVDDDKYQREKLVGDLETLRSFYMDRGYADFGIESTQIAISPDHKSIYVTINIHEGDVYKIKAVKLAGSLIVPANELKRYIVIKPGDTFSMKRATDSADFISKRLGADGYAFAHVNPIPDLDHDTKEAKLTFFVDPGSRVYVRRINFRGAPSTDDIVFRREMRQLEGTWLSNVDLERSRIRIQRLPFVEDVKVNTDKVPGSPDLVDLDFDVKERRSIVLQAGVGYGSAQGLLLNGQYTDANFLGQGKRMSFNLNSSVFSKQYNVSYTNPYYTLTGVSRTISANYQKQSSYLKNSSPFSTDSYALTMNFGYPTSEYDSVFSGGTVRHTELVATPNYSSNELLHFVEDSANGSTFTLANGQKGVRFNTYELTAGWAHDTRNRVIFADRGTRRGVSLNIAVPGSDVKYYTLNLSQQSYLPLGDHFTYGFNGQVAFARPYGRSSTVPPYQHFYAGGPDSVRGYKASYLGPLDSNGLPFGGTLQTYMQNELILPNFFSDSKISKSARFSLFYDVGNVFAEPGDFNWGQLRSSVGVAATWLTPLGAMRFSWAHPINAKPGDQTESFQFALGSYF